MIKETIKFHEEPAPPVIVTSQPSNTKPTTYLERSTRISAALAELAEHELCVGDQISTIHGNPYIVSTILTADADCDIWYKGHPCIVKLTGILPAASKYASSWSIPELNFNTHISQKGIPNVVCEC